MKKHLLKFLLALFLFAGWQSSFGQGLEDFTNSNATSTYSNNSFVGNNAITWTYVASRDANGDANGSGITLPALMLRRSDEPSSITSSTISGGIGDFEVRLYKGFTGGGNRQVELFINGESKGTSVAFDDFDEHIFTVSGINVGGDFTMEIRNITTKQVIIDSIYWTAYTDVAAPVATWDPVNTASDVVINTNITITFDEAIRNIDDSEITNANVASLLVLKETNAAGADVAFTATIDVTKQIITIDPTSDLANDQLYYVAIAPVEDASDNATSGENITFTTISATAGTITLTYPVGGEKFYAGDEINITWSSANVTTVDVMVYVPDEAVWDTIIPNTPSDGAELFTIPTDAPYSDQYKLAIVDSTNSLVADTSLVFTVISTPTINDIQSDTTTGGDVSNYDGHIVKTSGIVTAIDGGNYFIQDGAGEWNGIQVIDGTNTPAIGDSITIEATVEENYNLTRLNSVTDYTLNNSGNTLPNATVITTGTLGESYEGVLVKIVNAEVTNPNAGYGQYEINDGSGALLTDDDIFVYVPVANDQLTITGIGHYSYSARKFLARDMNDIISASDTVTSTEYTINSETNVISDIPYGTDLATFEGNIAACDTAAFDVFDTDGTTPATVLDETKKLIVTAADGITERTYTIDIIAASTDATVTSGVYTVNDVAETITDVPFGTDLATFKSNITAPTYGSFEVYESDGTTPATVLATGCILTGTAEDGTTTKDYTITVNTIVMDDDSNVGDPTTQVAAATIVVVDGDETAEAFEVFSFDINDLGTADGEPTNVSQIVLFYGPNMTIDFETEIDSGYFEVNGLPVDLDGEPVFGTDSVAFPILNGEISVPDGGSVNVVLHLVLNPTVADGKIIQFFVDADQHGFEARTSGSGFASTFAADVVGNNITIDVVATELNFSTQPTDVYVGDAITPAVVVEALDANGNTDTDYVTDISITATGATLAGTPVVVTPVAGVATFNALSFSDEGTGVTLTAASGTLTNDISTTFNVTVEPEKDLFFSEYIEGSSSNKAFEIYNPTASAIDLSDYVIKQSYNGGGWGIREGISDSRYVLPLSGSIAAGDVYVIINSQADIQKIIDAADLSLTYDGTANNSDGSNVAAFNGNDAIGLFKNDVLIDAFGDPLSNVNFDVAGITAAAKDHTLLRKSGTTIGNTDWASSAGTNNDDSEWVVFTIDYVDDIGSFGAKSGTDILTYTFAEQTGAATIDDVAHTVAIEVAYGISPTALVATFTLSSGATAKVGATDQVSGTTPNDFSSPVTYIITAEDASTQDWVVTVTVATTQSSAKEVTSFTVEGIVGTATLGDGTITATVEYGTDITSLKPVFEVSALATIADTATARDFTTAQTYVVTAEDASTKDWLVTITAETVSEVTVYDIQYTTDASGVSPYLGELIKTSGIVTAIDGGTLWIQDGAGAWNGVFVYSSATADAVSVGDDIEFVAEVYEYYDLTELKSVQNLNIISSGNTLPAATEITTLQAQDEDYEGVLIKISNASCTNVDAGNGMFEVNDGSGVLLVDDDMYAFTPTLDAAYDITGIGHYSYSNRKILPRDASDINEAPSITSVTLSPATPSATDAVTITATITDDATAAADLTVGLYYGSAEGSEDTEVTFAQVGTTDEFEGTIPASSSTVYYKVTANDGSLSSEYTGNYSITTGINNPDGIVSLNIFPNPSNGKFTLEMNASKAGTFNVEIINIQGQVIFTKEINQDGFYQETIDISNNAIGIYYIRINDGKNLKVSKIIIQ